MNMIDYRLTHVEYDSMTYVHAQHSENLHVLVRILGKHFYYVSADNAFIK